MPFVEDNVLHDFHNCRDRIIL